MNESLKLKWSSFHRVNPHVWVMFEQRTIEAIRDQKRSGKDLSEIRLSAKAMIEYLRWEIRFETKESDFKIDNSLTAYYARYFVTVHPEYRGVFELRNKTEKEVA